MRIFNIQQLFIGRRLRLISLSFILVVFFFALPNVANAGVTVISSSNPTCHNVSNGSVTVQATNVGSGPYVYTISGGTILTSSGEISVLSHPFNDLPAGSYTIELTDNGVDAGSCSIDLFDPGELSIDVTPVKGWTCGAADCVGELNIAFSEGVGRSLSYNVLGEITSVNSSPISLSDLWPGTYTFTLTDGNGCTPSQVERQFTIVTDDAPPTCSNVPVDEVTPIAFYESMASSASLVNFPLNLDKQPPFNTSAYFEPNAYTSSSQISSNGFDNMELRINATPTGSDWQLEDVIRVIIHYPDDVLKNQIEIFPGGVDLSNITIPIRKTDQDAMSVEINWGDITSPGCSYDITSVELWVIAVHPMIFSSSIPSSCDNNIGTSDPVISSSDGPVTWFCTVPEPELEFSFIRTWYATDDCGNSTPFPQRLSVGTEPKFETIPGPVTYDFCNNSNVPISAPTVSDNCTDAANLVLEWMVFDVAGNSLSVWYPYSSVTTYNFTPDPGGQVFRIGWRVTDEAGISKENDASTTTQTITFTPAISATIDILSPGINNICEGNPVTFRIAPTGGTESFDVSSFDPADGIWNGTNYLYTNNFATAVNNRLGVKITDKSVTGTTGTCISDDIYSPYFDVHKKITTNPITRTP